MRLPRHSLWNPSTSIFETQGDLKSTERTSEFVEVEFPGRGHVYRYKRARLGRGWCISATGTSFRDRCGFRHGPFVGSLSRVVPISLMRPSFERALDARIKKSHTNPMKYRGKAQFSQGSVLSPAKLNHSWNDWWFELWNAESKRVHAPLLRKTKALTKHGFVLRHFLVFYAIRILIIDLKD